MNPHPTEPFTANSQADTPSPAQDAQPRHLLLIEDDAEFRKLVGAHLRRAGFVVTECASGYAFVSGLNTFTNSPRPVDLIISDVRVPGLTGLEIVEGLRALQIDVPVIFMTAYGDASTHQQAQALKAIGTFDKPFDIEDLVTAVQMLLCPAAGPPRSARP